LGFLIPAALGFTGASSYTDHRLYLLKVKREDVTISNNFMAAGAGRAAVNAPAKAGALPGVCAIATLPPNRLRELRIRQYSTLLDASAGMQFTDGQLSLCDVGGGARSII